MPWLFRWTRLQTLRDAPVVFGRYGDNFERGHHGHRTQRRQDGWDHPGLEVGEKIAARNSYVIKADITGKASASHDH